jgi:hypothetical protein
MPAQILSISSVPRSSTHEWADELRLEGFAKGLALKAMLGPVESENKTAINNWLAAGKLNEAERDVFYEAMGWGRGS